MRWTKVAALGAVVAIATATAPAPADAASPASATISINKRAVSWQGENVTVSSIAFDPAGLGTDCNLTGDPFCDHFFLKINLPYDAKIQVVITTANPSDAVKPYNDFDVFIYPPGGRSAPMAAGTSVSGNEQVEFTHRARMRTGSYDIAVQPYLVLPGSSYKGTVKILSIQKG